MILVVGATGSLGGHITRGLLAKEKEVRILVRHNSPSEMLVPMGRATAAQSLIDAGAQPVYADLKDRGSLDTAVADIDTIITTATATQREDPDDLESVDLQGTLNLIAAAKAAGVKHFIYTSAYGGQIGHPNPLFHIKATCVEAVVNSGMTYTILLPGIFFEVWAGMVIGIPLQAGQPVTLIGKGDHKHAFISQADVAKFAVASVDNPAACNAQLPLSAPGAYSWTEKFGLVNAAMGMQLPVNYLPLGSEVPLVPPMVGGLLNAHETYESVIDMGDTAEKFGVTMTPMADCAKMMFGQLPA